MIDNMYYTSGFRILIEKKKSSFDIRFVNAVFYVYIHDVDWAMTSSGCRWLRLFAFSVYYNATMGFGAWNKQTVDEKNPEGISGVRRAKGVAKSAACVHIRA